MKTKLVLFTALFALFFIACKKDKFTTKPQINVKSISPGEVVQGDIISIQAKFTDEEGDLDSVYVIMKYYDGNVGAPPKVSGTPIDTLRSAVDAFKIPPNTRDGDIFIKFSYGRNIQGYTQLQLSPVTKDTTAAFGIVVIDKAKNRSEYNETGKIRLLK
ncbi:MAG TPA: hypothetical protein VF476_02945 [Chitinophagaceae bacterium]